MTFLKDKKGSGIEQRMQIEALSNEDLLLLLHSFVGVERGVMGKVLAYLGEVDARGLYADKSCSSMFDFCVHRLKLSEDQACRRIAVARLARQFPAVLEAITNGDLHLTRAQRLQPFLTKSNVDELIAQASGKTRSQLDLLIAKLAPKPDVPESISVVPEQRDLTALANTARPATSPSVAAAQVRPLSEASYCITFTVPAPVHDMLQEVRTMMRHQNITGDVASIFARGLERLHQDLLKQTRGATKRPRRSKASSDPRASCSSWITSSPAHSAARATRRTCGCAVPRTIDTLPNRSLAASTSRP